MKKPSTSPPNTPKAIRRRYQRRTARSWAVVVVLAICAMWSSLLLVELISPTDSDFRLQSAKDRRDTVWLMLPLDLLRTFKFGDHAIRVTLVLVFIVSALSASILAFLLFRLSPEGYWHKGKKDIAE